MNRHVPVVLLIIGLVLCIANAVDYLGGYNMLPGGFTVFGILLVVLGMYMGKKGKG